MTQQRFTTGQLAVKASNGYTVIINGQNKSYFQLINMKGKTYLVTVDGKTLRTTNFQTA